MQPEGTTEKVLRETRNWVGTGAVLMALFLPVAAVALGGVSFGANEMYKSELRARTASNKIVKDNKERK